MFWTEEKLAIRINELREWRYRDLLDVTGLRWQSDPAGEIGARPPENGSWQPVRLGHRWEGRDLYVWLAAEAAIPPEWADRPIVGRFSFGKTGGGTNSGFESLLYVNGVPYQGVDSNHTEVFFGVDTAGTELQLRFRLWSGLEGGGRPRQIEHKLEQAQIGWLDRTVDDLYFTAKAVHETVLVLETNRPEREMLLAALDRAMLELDGVHPGSARFYETAEAALRLLKQELDAIPGESPVKVTGIGHTHIDVAWLWRLRHTREKAARSFATVLRLMEQYPDYVFLQTQPQLYAYIKQDYPELYEQMKARIREGRWEAEGGMWLEADCNVTSGESLVRQLLYGTRFLKREFGIECRYLWLPDVFGYSWALPQILRKAGIQTFMTTKISWSEYNRFPHDTFRWRGIDGSEVLTHYITTPDGGSMSFYTYNGFMTATMVKGLWDSYRDKRLNRELLLSYGYGDGGGGVNREMLEMRRRFERMPGLPNVETGRADEFFDRLHRTVDRTDQYVHTWDGELYLEYHRGTYTTQAHNKRMNRKLELLYRELEWLSAWAALSATGWSEYPQQQIDEGWQILLRNQFHDIIPGSSIREVYEDSSLEYREAQQLALSGMAAAEAALTVIPPESGDYTVFNSASWDRTDLLELTGPADATWQLADGSPLTAQRSETGGWLVKVNEVPSMGMRHIRCREASVGSPADSRAEALFTFTGDGIMTPHYELRWNEQGQLIRVFDRTNGRDVLQPGECGNVLQVFEDKPRRHDAWDIDLYYQQKMAEVRELQRVELVEAGPLRATVRFCWRYADSRIEQRLRVYADSRRIDFETQIDWRERQQMLKVAFPVAIRSTEATFDIQFGNVKRPTHWNTSWDYARFETVGHQWADLSEHGYGVSLLNDCKYGHDIKDHRIRLTLLRSPIYPDYEADQGEHRFTYSLYPHQGDWLEGGTVQEAWQLNSPLFAAAGKPGLAASLLLRPTGSHVLIDAVKKAEDEDSLVIRVHEYAGGRGTVRMESDYRVTEWTECDLLERPISETRREEPIEFSIRPYELKTFLVKLANRA